MHTYMSNIAALAPTYELVEQTAYILLRRDVLPSLFKS